MEGISSEKIKLLCKYFKAKLTTIELARDRGYDVDIESQVLVAVNEYESNADNFKDRNVYLNLVTRILLYYMHNAQMIKHQESKLTGNPVLANNLIYFEVPFLDVIYNHKQIQGNVLLIQFDKNSEATEQGVAYAQNFLDRMRSLSGTHRFGISVINQPLGSHAAPIIADRNTADLQVFQLDELQYNPTKHCLQPRYQILTAKQQRQFLTNSNLKIKQLPQMSLADPISRYYGLQVGQVIKRDMINITIESGNGNFTEFCYVESIPYK
jgi:DNA-directed RNA polymerase subunit H (RpoH/RPB5)